ncbi:MAG: TIM barrel protein [Ruminococcus sp.]
MLRAGVSTACLYPRVVEEALYDLALSGVSNVEIFINSHSELRRSFVDTMARLLHRFDMTCVSLHPFTCEIEPTMLFSNYPRRADDYLEYCRHYFSAMQQLGAKVFVLHGNKVPAASVNKEMYFERFRRLAELGDSYGVQVAQENVARCTSASLPFLLEMRMPWETGEIRPGHQAGGALRRRSPCHAARAGVSCGTRHMSDHGDTATAFCWERGAFGSALFWKCWRRSADCSVILELYRSGFSDVAELAANYTLLQNRIRSAETAGKVRCNAAMYCPFCGNINTRVMDSRSTDEKIRRRRECLGCGKRFTTYEAWNAPC